MPVTARLSKAFYDRLGEEIANELVEWFNLVDATYRSNLRELNELNFARFEAKVEQRLAQLESKFEQRFSAQDAKIDVMAANLNTTLERGLKDQTRFYFVAWAILLASNIALWFR